MGRESKSARTGRLSDLLLEIHQRLFYHYGPQHWWPGDARFEIIIGAILVGTYFSMIGAAGGMLMAAFQVLIVHTAGPVGINAANVLKPSNMALTLFSPLGSFYRYAVKERRVAWPVGISFGVGIFIGSIWLGKYVSAYLPLKAYKEWLAILVVIMGIQTLRELMPKAMEKRKNIKAMMAKFNKEVAKAKEEGRYEEAYRSYLDPLKERMNVLNSATSFYAVQEVIDPRDTRHWIVRSLRAMVDKHEELPEKKRYIKPA